MLLRMFKSLATMLVIYLAVMGLNISNQGINQVSGESRGPVINLVWHDNTFYWDWLGSGHEYSTVPMQNSVKYWIARIKAAV